MYFVFFDHKFTGKCDGKKETGKICFDWTVPAHPIQKSRALIDLERGVTPKSLTDDENELALSVLC